MAGNANTVATGYVQIIPSTKGIKGSLTKVLSPEASAAGMHAGHGIAGAIKKVLVSAGIGAAIMKGIDIGSELEQNLGGTEAVFGEYAKDLQTIASDAYKNMGMSASEYMATANKMTSLFKGSGIETKKAMDMSSMAMQRAADVASVMGVDMDMAMESIAGAAKGNFTMMDNLGVAMNATTLQAYALEKGINFEWRTASQAEKSAMAMEMFMERTENMAGNFARESEETISGSLGAMKSAFKDLVGNMVTGGDIKKPLKALMKTTTTFVAKNFLPAVARMIGALPEVITEVISTMGPQLMESGLNMIDNLAKGLVTAIPTLTEKAIELIQGTILAINEYLPQILTSLLNLLLAIGQGLVEALPMLIENLPLILGQILQSIVTFFSENGVQILNAAIELMVQLGKGLLKGLPGLITNLGTVLGDMVQTVLDIDWIQLGKDIIQGIVNGIKNMAFAVVDALFGVVQAAVNTVRGWLGIASPSKMFTYFGEMIDAGLVKGIDGDSGKVNKSMKGLNSILTPNENKMVGLMAQTGRQLNGTRATQSASVGAGYNQTVNVYAPQELSAKEVARQTRNATRQMALQLRLDGAIG